MVDIAHIHEACEHRHERIGYKTARVARAMVNNDEGYRSELIASP